MRYVEDCDNCDDWARTSAVSRDPRRWLGIDRGQPLDGLPGILVVTSGPIRQLTLGGAARRVTDPRENDREGEL